MQLANKKDSTNYLQLTGDFGTNFDQTLRLLKPAVLMGAQLAVPQLMLSSARKHEPHWNKKGQWVWKYSVHVAGYTFNTKLLAVRRNDDSVSWKFYASNSKLQMKNQLLISGSSSADNTKGRWETYYGSLLFNKHTGKQKDAVLHWNTQGSHDITLNIKYTGNAFKEYTGDHLTYYSEGSVVHLAYFSSGSDKPIVVQWDFKSQKGFIVNPHFNNGNKACWGTKLQNIPCSAS
jgi:hypothetical protein